MIPEVSIIVPHKNRCKLLQETLASIVSQSFERWEALVVDDASADDSPEVVAGLSSRDSRIRWIDREQLRPGVGGAQVCRNVGTQESRGNYLLFLDSDDQLDSECLEQRLNCLRNNDKVDFVVGQCEHFTKCPGDLPGKIWAEWSSETNDLDSFLGIGRIPWQTSGPLWRSSALTRIGGWDEELVHVGHDHEFHVRALVRGLHYQKLNKVDYYWRAPRKDSLSSFESFKKHHANGGMIKAYCAILNCLNESHAWTPARRRSLANEAIRLAIQSRLSGGAFRTAAVALESAKEYGIINSAKFLECSFVLRLWFNIFGKLPALSYFCVRYPSVYEKKH